MLSNGDLVITNDHDSHNSESGHHHPSSAHVHGVYECVATFDLLEEHREVTLARYTLPGYFSGTEIAPSVEFIIL